MTSIPVFDYLEQYGALEGELLEAVRRVLRSGKLILGPEVAAFEQAMSAFLGAEPAGAVGVASGTDALVVALRALGVGAGDDVVTVANTAVPTVSAIRQVGARPRFCDVDPETALMDVEALAPLLDARVKAIVPVHLYGGVANVPRIRELVGDRPIAILEDCAQALGSTLDGKNVGVLGDAAAFSFYPTKNLGAFGDGGLCVSMRPEVAERMRRVRVYGMDAEGEALFDGQCSRLDELHAALLHVKLRRLPDALARRRSLAERYDRMLGAGVRRLRAAPGARNAPHLYVVRVRDRTRVREALAKRGIGTGVHYPMPIHRMTAYRDLGHAAGSLPHTERLAAEVLSLPLYPELTEAAVDEVCAALEEITGGAPPP